MLILGIETSCDETSAAIVRDGQEILSNVISSQLDLHREYCGVVPELASRRHVEVINPVIQKALDNAKIGFADIDMIAVTNKPGLAGALLVGISAAEALGFALGKPVTYVNHLDGHRESVFLAPIGGSKNDQNGQNSKSPQKRYPYISLLVSGGHTIILNVKSPTESVVMGQTRDDAAGEAFDKVARHVGFGYPGGPIVDKLARDGNPKAIDFPRALMDEGFDFSFSGLKTATITYIRKNKIDLPLKGQTANDFAASFQKAIVDVLVTKTIKAAQEAKSTLITLAGGVSANSLLRNQLKTEAEKAGIDVIYPPLSLCGDNAAMIAAAGYQKFIHSDN